MTTTSISAILAHQGGWDEGLIVAAPLLVVVGLLWAAKRRTSKLDHNQQQESATPSASDE